MAVGVSEICFWERSKSPNPKRLIPGLRSETAGASTGPGPRVFCNSARVLLPGCGKSLGFTSAGCCVGADPLPLPPPPQETSARPASRAAAPAARPRIIWLEGYLTRGDGHAARLLRAV